MMKVGGKMPSKMRLEKIGIYQSMKGQFIIKYLNSHKFPVFSLSGKIDTKFPVFPVPWTPR